MPTSAARAAASAIKGFLAVTPKVSLKLLAYDDSIAVTMKFLRHCLFALVLLRLLTGTAWAMPSMPAMPAIPMVTAEADFHAAMPCHGVADQPPPQSGSDHTGTPCSPLWHMCCMGFGLIMPVLHAPTAQPAHAQPAHRARDVARWQHVPDLRPPIQTSEN